MVDVLTTLSQNPGESVFSLLRDPVLKLFSIFVLQVRSTLSIEIIACSFLINRVFSHFQAFFTFVYIDFVSAVGENIAGNLKKALFESVMQQDLTFFDVNRTGEIIERYILIFEAKILVENV